MVLQRVGTQAAPAVWDGPEVVAVTARLTEEDARVVTAFSNFPGWGVRPNRHGCPAVDQHVPPAWFAYAWGLTNWCPPVGTL